MKSNKKVLVCVAWPYVNGDLHIGHLAGYLLPADIFVRFQRLLGNEAIMVSGSDCYGTPTTVEADKEGVSPKEIVDKYHPSHLELFDTAKISFDIFTKTTTQNHKKVVQDIFIKLLDQGLIIRKTQKQFYSEEDEKFLPDRYVEGSCPFCSYQGARSDQCEDCGRIPTPERLKNPVSRLTGSKIILKDTEHYFLDWPKLQPFLKKYFSERGKNWKVWVQNETEGWLKKGLQPRSITRDLDWGIEIPIDRIPKENLIDNVKDKRIYVWFEAVIGYLSATIEWAEREKRDWKDFWYPSAGEKVRHYYFMGKDNLVFHTLFWPGQLYGYDKEIHLPDVVSINQFLNFEGGKFSKSKGRIIDSKYIINEYGLDPVRFYLTLIMPEHADSSFSWDDFGEKVNGILIGNLGNFINRTLSLAKGEAVAGDTTVSNRIIRRVGDSFNAAASDLSSNKYKSYLESILSLSSFGNKFTDEEKPWKTKKGDKKKFAQSIVNSIYIVLALSLLMKPLLPEASEKVEKMLGVSIDCWPVKKDLEKVLKEALSKVNVGGDIQPLFEKIDEKRIEREKGV